MQAMRLISALLQELISIKEVIMLEPHALYHCITIVMSYCIIVYSLVLTMLTLLRVCVLITEVLLERYHTIEYKGTYCRVILYHTAKAAFIYVLHTELYAYVDAHCHRCVLAQPKGQLSIANYLT